MVSKVETSTKLVWTETWESLAQQKWNDAELSVRRWEALTEYFHKVDEYIDLTVSSACALGAGLNYEESIAVTSGETKTAEVALAESLTVGDLIVRDMAMRLTESIVIDELVSKGFTTEQVENFKMASAAQKMPSINVLRNLGFDEEIGKDFEQALKEAIAILTAPSKEAGISKDESFDVSSEIEKAPHVIVKRALAISEGFGRVVEFKRAFEEAFTTISRPSKEVGKKVASAFELDGALVLPANMVIADMLIEKLDVGQDLTMTNFLQSLDMGAMPGWTPWRTFLPGDYEYTKAMFRVLMDSVSADRAVLEEATAAVDVPDVIDRGSARVTSAANGVAVEFERIYHVIPEITLTAKGGTGTNPTAAELVGNPTLLGFTAKLRDTVTGEYVTGTFTWASHGY